MRLSKKQKAEVLLQTTLTLCSVLTPIFQHKRQARKVHTSYARRRNKQREEEQGKKCAQSQRRLEQNLNFLLSRQASSKK